MARSFQKSIYIPVNRDKFTGKRAPVARSSWERSFMEYFDMNPHILEWMSEPFAIPYYSPVDGKMHRYYPDFLVAFQSKSGEIKRQLIEVKPAAQARRSRSRKASTRMSETVVYTINQAKWKAAFEYCAQHEGLDFKIMTEKGDVTADFLKSIS